MASEATEAYTKVQDTVDDALYDAFYATKDTSGRWNTNEVFERIMKAVDEYAKAIRDEESGS
jgi:hypothetical protein